MKTLSKVLFIALFSVALISCSDDGPVSVNDKDGSSLKTNSLSNLANLSHTYSEVWDRRGTDSEKCELAGEEGRPASGWIHWVFNTKGESTDARLIVSGSGSGEYEPGPPLNANVWHFYTPFFDLEDLEAEIFLFGGNKGSGGGLVISDFCPGAGQSLDVSKTVDTYYIRTHDWSIEKDVDTENGYLLDNYAKIWLYTDARGNEKATWTIDVTYEGYEDSGWNVSGIITIENIGTEAKTITSIVDELDGTPISIDCEDTYLSNGSYILPVGETMTCAYSEDGYVEGFNVVTVTVEGEDDPYTATEEIVWGDPGIEINETVQVNDISDLFGTKNLGSVTAPLGDQFTYYKDFAFAYYNENEECGAFEYDNVAQIIGDDDAILDSDDATLKVNVQCFVYESAWTKGNPNEAFCDNGFNNWGWTNPMQPGNSQNMPLWAGAGQCDTTKGTLVGHVEVSYNGGFTYNFVLNSGHILNESHVYAGLTMFPQRRQGRNGWVNTVAPGQYYITPDLSGNIYVIAHGVVGLPDPDFGPAE